MRSSCGNCLFFWEQPKTGSSPDGGWCANPRSFYAQTYRSERHVCEHFTAPPETLQDESKSLEDALFEEAS